VSLRKINEKMNTFVETQNPIFFMKTTTLLSVLLLYASTIQAQTLQEAKTSELAGMSAERFKRIDGLLKDQIDKKWLPGAVAIVARNGVITYHQALGTSGIGNDQAMKKNDIFRIASMTKPVTTIAMMLLLEEGKYMLDEPVAKYIPEFKTMNVLDKFNEKDTTYTTIPAKRPITIRQLLTHTSGIGYGFTDKTTGSIYAKAKLTDLATTNKMTIADEVKILATLPLLHEPGAKFTYSLSTDVLGYLVEVLSGMNLSDYCEKHIFQPIGMTDTHFFRPEADETRIVNVYGENKEGTLVKYSPDSPEAKRLSFPTRGAKTYFSGGSGLSSTALDYAKFLQMIVNGGTYNGRRLVSRKTIELMSTNQIGDLTLGGGTQFGFGLSILTEKGTFRQLSSAGRLAWGGAFNTTFWIDPKEKMVVVLMTQIYPTSHQSELYTKFETLVYQSIID
jgi:CubicO group peptidase (beta-lactamase class C family)